MAAKMRRHSVAVMSTSYLPQSATSSPSLPHRTTPPNGVVKAPPSATGNRAASSKQTRDGAAKTSPSISNSSSAAASAVRARRHSVAVHPGALLSVMESGRQATAAAESKKMLSKPHPASASDIIDDLIRSADAALIRNCPMPTGSTLLQAAIQELDESKED